MRFHHVDHIGVAVADLDGAIATYTRLFGVGPSAIETVVAEQVRVAFFDAGSTRIELIAATDAASPIAKFLAKRGPGIHHLGFAVPNLTAALTALKGEGFTPIAEGPRTGADGHAIAFLRPKETGGVLIELVESQD